MMPANGSILVQCGGCQTIFRFRLPETASEKIYLKCGVCETLFVFPIPRPVPQAERPEPPVEHQEAEDSFEPQPQGVAQAEPEIEPEFEPEVEIEARLEAEFKAQLEAELKAELEKASGQLPPAAPSSAPPETKPLPKTMEMTFPDVAQQGPQPVQNEGDDTAAAPADEARPPRRFGLFRAISLAAVLVLLLAAGGFLWMNPEMGRDSWHWVSGKVPVLQKLGQNLAQNLGEKLRLGPDLLDRILGSGSAREADPVVSVQLGNLKQRVIASEKLGRLRIIEGTATNGTDLPLVRIRVMAKLYDEKTKLLAIQTASCGRLLSDERLARMSEQELIAFRDGAVPNEASSDRVDERVSPRGEAPFMIVFAADPPGVAQAEVVAVSAQKAVK